MKPIEFHIAEFKKNDFKTNYIRYRVGRIKHELWLMNRKNKEKILYDDDKRILKNCQQGKTLFFDSAGYYIKDLYPKLDIDVVESKEIVKDFYPNCIIMKREDLPLSKKKYDNVVITNSRGDAWVNLDKLSKYFTIYSSVMNHGCKFFYSFRDTQTLGFNRLKVDMENYFLDWAKSLISTHQLALIDHDIQFPKKVNLNGRYDLTENPDVINGNIKLSFIYQGKK